jgi:carbonic anhydrase
MRAILVLLACTAVARADAPSGHSADDALKRLVAGNAAFVAGGGACPHQSAARRSDVASAQHPIAVVVGCADSRVPPEVLFGQGIGDLFVVRVAGNVADDDAIGSVEYAVEHLGASLVVVLGHSRCGAVEAALAPASPPGHLGALVARIKSAIAGTHSLDAAIRANVAAQVQKLQTAQPVLAPRAKTGKVRVVGARYDLDSGDP